MKCKVLCKGWKFIVERPARVGCDEITRKGTTGEKMPDEEPKKGRQPDYRIVQAETDKDGKSKFTNVGAIWMNEGGKSAGVVKIGDLRLVLFKNTPKK